MRASLLSVVALSASAVALPTKSGSTLQKRMDKDGGFHVIVSPAGEGSFNFVDVECQQPEDRHHLNPSRSGSRPSSPNSPSRNLPQSPSSPGRNSPHSPSSPQSGGSPGSRSRSPCRRPKTPVEEADEASQENMLMLNQLADLDPEDPATIDHWDSFRKYQARQSALLLEHEKVYNRRQAYIAKLSAEQDHLLQLEKDLYNDGRKVSQQLSDAIVLYQARLGACLVFAKTGKFEHPEQMDKDIKGMLECPASEAETDSIYQALAAQAKLS